MQMGIEVQLVLLPIVLKLFKNHVEYRDEVDSLGRKCAGYYEISEKRIKLLLVNDTNLLPNRAQIEYILDKGF